MVRQWVWEDVDFAGLSAMDMGRRVKYSCHVALPLPAQPGCDHAGSAFRVSQAHMSCTCRFLPLEGCQPTQAQLDGVGEGYPFRALGCSASASIAVCFPF
jgi:hypothetical protein